MHKEEIHNFHASPNTSKVIKSRMGLAGHVACMERREMHKIFWLESLQRRSH